jgi:hypothetical protein
MAAYLLTQDREILAKSTPVHLARVSFMHPIICSTLRGAPPYSPGQSDDVVAVAAATAKL